ncbi:hypothetical protein LDC_1982 [sediment metagenome]|uniref:Uncharacterized protein n=1 Tax=sediment metagenome TaxID=749907 RepID=D9PKB7_9ZZZZ
MTLSDWQLLSEGFADFATGIAVLVGGGWAFWKYGLQREAHPKIQFDIDLNVLGKQGDSLLVEVAATITNKGLVRVNIRRFRLDLLYLSRDAKAFSDPIRFNGQVQFQPIFKDRYWFPEAKWQGTFIDPGVCQSYAYISSAPADARFLHVWSRFQYPDAESDFHTAQRTCFVQHELASRRYVQLDVPEALQK